MATENGTFSYKPTTSGTYTWNFRMKNSGTVAQPASVCYLDNLQVSYPYPYTRIDCDKGPNASYRYGFNGKENDMETLTQDYGFRIYNPGLGRFLSVDPLTKSYPWYTPYQFAGNTPIQAIDLDGLEPEYIVNNQGKLCEPVLNMFNSLFLYDKTMMNNITITRDPNMSSKENAGTYNSTSITTNSNSVENKNDGNKWLRTLSHEIKHVEQYANSFSQLLDGVMYSIDKFFNGYRNTKDEREAFAIGDIMNDFNSKHNPSAILSNNSLTDNQKTTRLLIEVSKYKINNIQNTMSKIDQNMEKYKREGNDEKIKYLESLKKNVYQLALENETKKLESLQKEISNETKKK